MISYDDVLNSSGMPAFLQERRQRYFDKARAFCRGQFPGRFGAASDAEGLAHVKTAYGIGKSFGLRSERDHLKLLIATVHWGLGLASDPRLALRMVRAGWLEPDLSARHHVKPSQLLRAVDDWHAQVRPEGRAWVDAAAQTAPINASGLSGSDALYMADEIWPVGVRQMPAQAWGPYGAALDADRQRWALDGGALVLHALLGLRLGYRYLFEPTLSDFAAAWQTDGSKAQRFDALLQAALAMPPLLQDMTCHRT